MNYSHDFLEALALDAFGEEASHADKKAHIFHSPHGRIYQYRFDIESQLWNDTTRVIVFHNADEGEHVLITNTSLSTLCMYPTMGGADLCSYEQDPDTLFTLLFENGPVCIDGFLENGVYYPSRRWTKSYEDFYDAHFRGDFPKEVTYKFYIDSGEIITFETYREYEDDITVQTMNITHSFSMAY